MFTVKKQFRDLPAAHRQPNHKGHCRWIHGHDWGFDITFGCETLDGCGFVIDVGKLGFVREFLKEKFDHTLLLNEDDPSLHVLRGALADPLPDFAKIVTVPNCGMEGLAKYVFEEINKLLVDADFKKRKLRVLIVWCHEDSKNSASYSVE